jgi:sodium transport system permease protein
MNFRNVLAVFGKELTDSIRDRRTLVSTIVLPTVIIPLLTFGTIGLGTKIVHSARQEKPIVMLVGGEDVPQVAAALAKSNQFRIAKPQENYRQAIVNKQIGAALVIPSDFGAILRRGEVPRAEIHHYEGELRSGFAADELEEFFREFREQHVIATLASRDLPARALRPFELARRNVAPPEKVGGNLVGGFVPYLIIVLCFTGAMYPAIDLTAGEKERGTLETLLCSPAARLEIVLGKFLLVLTGSLSAMAMSLLSMGITAAVTGAILLGRNSPGSPSARMTADYANFISLPGMFGVLIMVIPVAILFAAGQLTIALFARSSKEAQSYLGPMMIVVLLPAIIGMLPGVDLNAKLAWVPLLNLSLICKELLSGQWSWSYIAIGFFSTCLYAALALALAVRMFNREDVVFRT